MRYYYTRALRSSPLVKGRHTHTALGGWLVVLATMANKNGIAHILCLDFAFYHHFRSDNECAFYLAMKRKLFVVVVVGSWCFSIVDSILPDGEMHTHKSRRDNIFVPKRNQIDAHDVATITCASQWKSTKEKRKKTICRYSHQERSDYYYFTMAI